MKPDIQLPNNAGDGPVEIISCPGNLVIIGANGAGKTRLGSWIETQLHSEIPVHRISAQRALNIPEYATIKTLEQAQNNLFFGREDQHANASNKLGSRWGNSPSTFLLNDYDYVLSTLFARTAQRDSKHTLETKERETYIPVPDAPIDIIYQLWKDIMPQRELFFTDGQVFAKKNEQDAYHGKQMSDGERVALYLIGQCLCAPDNSVVIVDEPEIHLHRSLMARLWNKIEEACPDKLLVFITHDLDFAASRKNAKKIWIESFDGAFWNWNEIPEIEEIPENLTIEILGSRKNIIFSEGEKSSYDTILYQHVFPEHHVIPRGGCEKVVESTKAMRDTPSLHHLTAFGIIDSDYRTDEEIEALRNTGIYPIDVAEVENLFCIEPLLRIVASHLGLEEDEKVREVTAYLVQSLKDEFEIQITRRTERQIQFRLNAYTKQSNTEQGLKDGLDALLMSFDIPAMYAENQALFQKAIDDQDLEMILRYFNGKNLHKRIAGLFALTTNGYIELIIRLLKTEKKETIIAALRNFTPRLA